MFHREHPSFSLLTLEPDGSVAGWFDLCPPGPNRASGLGYFDADGLGAALSVRALAGSSLTVASQASASAVVT